MVHRLSILGLNYFNVDLKLNIFPNLSKVGFSFWYRALGPHLTSLLPPPPQSTNQQSTNQPINNQTLDQTRLQIASRSDTNRYPFVNQFLDCFFPDINSIWGTIWEAFEPLLVQNTKEQGGCSSFGISYLFQFGIVFANDYLAISTASLGTANNIGKVIVIIWPQHHHLMTSSSLPFLKLDFWQSNNFSNWIYTIMHQVPALTLVLTLTLSTAAPASLQLLQCVYDHYYHWGD